MMYTHQRPNCMLCSKSDGELFSLAKPILESSNPVEAATEALLRLHGIDGQGVEENAKLLLLAFTTRVLDFPAHTFVTGVHGSEILLVDAMLRSIPPCSLMRISGGGWRAIFANKISPKTLVVWEKLPHYRPESFEAVILREGLFDDRKKRATFCVLNTKAITDYRLACRMLPVEVLEWFVPAPNFTTENERRCMQVAAFGELMNRFHWFVRFPNPQIPPHLQGIQGHQETFQPD